ncbi:hypothetical protein ZWY2020_004588 [Hordeum vulgare]|nr:hypothetical protein ZWY2020_004588 [Hordeum vulgare]
MGRTRARAAAHVPVARADHPEGAACRSDLNYGGRALSQLPWSVQLTRPPWPWGLQEPVPVHARCPGRLNALALSPRAPAVPVVPVAVAGNPVRGLERASAPPVARRRIAGGYGSRRGMGGGFCFRGQITSASGCARAREAPN